MNVHMRICLAFLLTACSATNKADQIPASHTIAHGPKGWATTMVVADDNLPFPVTARRLLVVIDGTVIYKGKPPRDPSLIGLVELEPGDHVLQVLLNASYPLGLVGEDCRMELRTHRAFSADGFERGRIGLDLHLKRSAFLEVHERLRVRMGFDGVSGARTGYPPPDPKPKAAKPMVRTPEEAVEALIPLVEESRRNKDVISLLCHRDKLKQAEALVRMHAQRRKEVARTSDPAVVARVIEVIKQKSQALVDEAHQCVCRYPAYHEQNTVVLDGAGCIDPDVPPIPSPGH